jgi:S1-C subfamily serine protease
VIVEANGKAVDDPRMLRLMVSSMAPGSQVNLRVLREGNSRNVTLALGEIPVKETASAENSRQKPTAPSPPPRWGVAVTELTPEIAKELHLSSDTKGIVIAEVEEGGRAAEAGLQVGDVIQEVNHKPINGVNDFKAVLSKAGGDPLLLYVNRGGHGRFVALLPL